jgi:peroxiredoxin Q/BCP
MTILSWLFARPLEKGRQAPDFTLKDDTGKSVTLSQWRGVKNVVLIFYPGDDTSVCTRQLCEFRDRWPEVEARDTVVFGINPQSAAKHARFSIKYRYPFPLLVDKGQRVASLYHAAGLIVRRTVYLIGKDGTILYSSRGKPSPEEVLRTAE